MAKTNRWLEFKQASRRASYLDISVRWLRGKEPTDASIRNTVGILGLRRGNTRDCELT